MASDQKSIDAIFAGLYATATLDLCAAITRYTRDLAMPLTQPPITRRCTFVTRKWRTIWRIAQFANVTGRLKLQRLPERAGEPPLHRASPACPKDGATLGTAGVVESQLIVPMRTLESKHLIGVQKIRWLMDEREWQKKMIYGTRAKAAVFRLGSPHAPETWLDEVTPPA